MGTHGHTPDVLPADTPTEPIDAALMEVFVTMPEAQPTCDAYRAVMAAVDGLGLPPGDEAVFVDAVDAYTIVSIEGDTLRLSPEARDVIVDWLHLECAV